MAFFQKKQKDAAAELESIREERRYLLWRNSDFFLREAYKTTRTNVMFSLAGKEGCSVIAVTSSLQSEGKSITAINLAMTFADMGSRTLLVDCDLRKPKVNRLLEVAAPVGLTDVLVDRKLLTKAVHRFSEKKQLWTISSGKIPPNPSELLNSESMRALMSELKQSYDYILLDTPPVDVVTDAMVLAPLVDGFLFVVRAGKSDRRAVAHSLGQLEYANARVLGVVFNGSGVSGGYGYKKYGYKRYGYGRYGYGRYGYGYAQAAQQNAQNPAQQTER
ncbi:MAG: CpsD/CapB family tyrosine-protein kinase [Oscillospiraceae bacterium]|nr:CpsD/CapB family tyrosine-protein kinase [Oscillospiraceae bacterium]